MDARDALTRIYVSHHTSKEEWADNVIARLRHLGFAIVHRDENHGPTLERAAEAAEAFADQHDTAAIQAQADEAVSRFRGGEKALRGFSKSIRAMGEKKNG